MRISVHSSPWGRKATPSSSGKAGAGCCGSGRAVAEPPATVTLTIDGRAVTVARGTTVWHAAEQAGIDIPIFCYLDRMPPLGACRQCFVRVEKMARLQTSCTLVAEEGMVVSASTPDVRGAQERNLEFLLINHPLDCPICRTSPSPTAPAAAGSSN